ncbi:hypothetical protein, partial [Streptomyces yanii]
TTPGVPDRTENVTHTPPGIPAAHRAVHPIVPMFTKTTCRPSSCEPLTRTTSSWSASYADGRSGRFNVLAKADAGGFAREQ